MAWNEERVVLLKKYWADGLSAPQIAGKLGGVTRNAVTGKVQRLELKGRAAPASLRAFSNAIKASDADTRKEIQRLTDIFSGNLTDDVGPNPLKTAQEQCCWPLGDPFTDDFHYCGQSTAGGRGSYCALHAERAFQPARRRSGPPRTVGRFVHNPASR
ncbi:MAG: GcrA family cell cycle regulator [Patescibacteria group bacterium]